MHRTPIALFLAAALSPALAQTTQVSLYGIADAGVSLDRTGVPGEGYALRAGSGYLRSSRLGVTGTEDLGGGLRGLFTLELGFALDTGEFSRSSTRGAGFNRRALVGVQGGFGTLALGRDRTPLYQALEATDNLGFGLYGSLHNSTALAGGSETAFFRADNALIYTSPKIAGGLTLRALLGAGSESFGGALPRRAGRMLAVGGEYEGGPLTAAAVYQTVAVANAAGTDTDYRRDAMLGARYDFGGFSVGGGYEQVDPPGGDRTARQAWLGGSVRAGRGRLMAQVLRTRLSGPAGTDPRSTTMAIAYTHPLSRRTTGYVSLGRVSNNASADLGLYASGTEVLPGGGAAARGADPRGVAVGVRHAF